MKIKRLLSKITSLLFRILYLFIDPALAMAGRLLCWRRSASFLIMRPDNIGDYIHFRNFLPFVRESPKYRNMETILLGNQSFRELAEYLDGAYIGTFIWLDTKQYRNRSFRGFWYTLKLNWRLLKTRYACVFYSPFSRYHYFDTLVEKMRAEEKIACSGDNVNKANQPDITKRVYTHIIPTDPKPGVFEFERHKEIFGKLLCQKIELEYPVLEKLPEYADRNLPSVYVAVCKEAFGEHKQWPDGYFEQVIFYILNSKKLPVVLLGRDGSAGITEKNVIDLRGKTNLSETAGVLSKAICFIGNDSGLLHVSAAAGVKRLIALCFGVLYGRFAPYPIMEGRDYRFIFPPEISRNQHRPDYLREHYASGRYEDIKLIMPEQVIGVLDELLY